MYHPSNTDRKKEFNAQMAEVRITVEWGFKVVKGQFFKALEKD